MCVYICTYFTCRYFKYSTYKMSEVFLLDIKLYVFLTPQLAYGMDSNCIAKDPPRQCQFKAGNFQCCSKFFSNQQRAVPLWPIHSSIVTRLSSRSEFHMFSFEIQ